jgi:hypothetical protein
MSTFPRPIPAPATASASTRRMPAATSSADFAEAFKRFYAAFQLHR